MVLSQCSETTKHMVLCILNTVLYHLCMTLYIYGVFALTVQPLARMKVHLANMFSVREIHTNALFNYVFIPGTLCYADNLNQVQRFMEDLITYHIIEIGGKISITMLASDHSETGSCVTRISKAFWKSLKGYTVIDIQEMDSWNLPHALGRYAVFISA